MDVEKGVLGVIEGFILGMIKDVGAGAASKGTEGDGRHGLSREG